MVEKTPIVVVVAKHRNKKNIAHVNFLCACAHTMSVDFFMCEWN